MILQNLGFVLARKVGSHAQYKRDASGKRIAAVVTLDEGYREINDPKLIQSMIRQSGFSREEFYGATKRTARRASVQYLISGAPEAELE